MDATDLRALQAPLKQRYRDDPDAAVVTLKASGSLGEGITCSVDTGRALAEAGLHPATRRRRLAAVLGRHAARGARRLRGRDAARGRRPRSASTSTAGACSPRATSTSAARSASTSEAPVGFREVRLRFELDTDAGEDELATLLQLTERYCVVLQTLARPPELSAGIAGSAGA